MHTPVLLENVVESLRVGKGKKYVDATFGEGGHTVEILKKGGEVLAIEWDEEQLKVQSEKFKDWKNLRLVWGNYAEVEKIAKQNNFYPADGVLFDLGLSMAQIETSGRGFSYKKTNEPLDMRISRRLDTKASDIVNNLDEKKLYDVFAKNSEEVHSKKIVKALVSARAQMEIKKVGDLVRLIKGEVKSFELESTLRRIFQALRIEVNNEFANIKRGLEGAINIISRKGRIVVLSFQSVEDRIIKKFVQEKPSLEFLTKKPIMSKEGLRFERTAKMRVIVKK